MVFKPKRLMECMIENAIKFTSKGSVFIGTQLQQIHSKKYLVCSIRDTGIGMSQQQQSKMFAPFSQANTSYNRSADGLGLGLTVAKQIANVLEAKIDIESEIDKGTKATISLPIDY